MTRTKAAAAALLAVTVISTAAIFAREPMVADGVTALPTTFASPAVDENTGAPPLPELPAPEKIHRRAAKILAAPEYAPPRWQTLARRARQFWTGLWARDAGREAELSRAAELAIVAAGAFVILALGVWVTKRHSIPIFRLARIRLDPGPPSSHQSGDGVRGRPGLAKETGPWPAADRLAAAGDYPEALRLIYKELLAAWERRRLVADHQHRTDRQVGELIRQFAPGLYPEFMWLSRVYASCWYGRVPASPEIFAEFRRTARRLMEGSSSPPR